MGSTKNAVRYESAINQQLQIGFFDIGDLHLSFEQSNFEGLITVNGNHNSFPNSIFEEDMMTSLGSGQRPPLIGQKTAKIFSRNLFQTANSRSWEFLSAVKPEGSVSR